MIDYGFRSKVSNTSSPTTSVASVVWSVRSPPATRLRSRQASEGVGTHTSQTKPTSGRTADRSSKGKAKAKVEFKSNVEVHQKKVVRHSKSHRPTTESDLTELEELEKSLALGSNSQASLVQPSPRRLRSKDRQQASSEPPAVSHPQRRPTAPRRNQDTRSDAKSDKVNGWKKTRVLPSRKAKSSAEDTKEDEAENELSDEVDAEEAGSPVDDAEDQDQIVEGEGDEDAMSQRSSSEEEIDELASATSSPTARRTPLRKRLRPRRKMGSAGPSDGDDEGDGGEQSVVDDEMLDQDNEDGGDMDDAETDTAAERVDDEEAIAVEPRKLRSGKIVGEDDVHMDDEEDIGEEDEEDEDEEDEDIGEAEEGEDEGGDEVEDLVEAEEGEDEGGDEDAEGETDEEAMDEEGQFICLNTLVQP